MTLELRFVMLLIKRICYVTLRDYGLERATNNGV